MKRVFFFLFCTFFLTVAASAQSSRYALWSDYKPGVSDPDAWYDVTGDDNSTMLIRPSNVERKGDIVEYWVKKVFDRTDDEVYKVQEQINCKNKTIKIRYILIYWDWETEGNGIRLIKKLSTPRSSQTSNAQFMPIAPETVAEAKMKALCSLSFSR